MTLPAARVCHACGAPLAASARYCTRCGAPALDAAAAEEVMLPGARRLRISSDTLSLRELLAGVESGVFY